MPKIISAQRVRGQLRTRRIFFLFFLVSIFAVIALSNKDILSGDVSATQIFNPFGDLKRSELPPVPKIYGYNSVFWKIGKLKLTSFVPLPVLPGEKGRENPFLPFEDALINQGSGGGGGAENTMSQGSK